MPGTDAILQLDEALTGHVPELSRLPPVKLPASIDQVRRQLADAGNTIDPRQIDLCQLGAVLCQVLTGESVGAYLRSPRVKGLVPGELRPLLERMLGVSGRERFADLREFLTALSAASGQIPECHDATMPGADSQCGHSEFGRFLRTRNGRHDPQRFVLGKQSR